MTVLVVDVANVMGARPDGWWRDRAGAAARLLGQLAGVVGAEVAGPDGSRVVLVRVVAVVEGAAREVPAPAGVDVVRAPADGDSALVDAVAALAGEPMLVVTADRGLRERLPAGVRSAGPAWLLHELTP